MGDIMSMDKYQRRMKQLCRKCGRRVYCYKDYKLSTDLKSCIIYFECGWCEKEIKLEIKFDQETDE